MLTRTINWLTKSKAELQLDAARKAAPNGATHARVVEQTLFDWEFEFYYYIITDGQHNALLSLSTGVQSCFAYDDERIIRLIKETKQKAEACSVTS